MQLFKDSNQSKASHLETLAKILQRYWFNSLVKFVVMCWFAYRRACLMSLHYVNAVWIIEVNIISSEEGGQCTHPTPAGYRCKTKTTYKTTTEIVYTMLSSYKLYMGVTLYHPIVKCSCCFFSPYTQHDICSACKCQCLCNYLDHCHL